MAKLPTMKPNREERRKGMTDADKILVNIKKLSLQDGDVVAFSFRGQPSKEFTSSVAQALQNVGKKLTVLSSSRWIHWGGSVRGSTQGSFCRDTSKRSLLSLQ
jgi:hypothetical protein